MKKILLLSSIIFWSSVSFGQALGTNLGNFTTSQTLNIGVPDGTLGSRFNIQQTTASITLSVPTPTNTTTKVTEFWIENKGTVSFNIQPLPDTSSFKLDTGCAVILKWIGAKYAVVGKGNVVDLSGYVPTTRTITINGTTYDLSADRSWTIAAVDTTGLMRKAGGVFTGNVNGVTPTQLTYLNSLTSNVQTQLNGKQAAGATAGGDLVGTYPNPTLNTTAVTAGSYTNANITVDSNGRLTSASSGSAGGVTSFNTRTGAVVPDSGDYTFSQISSTPTTVSGYGITDVYTKTASDARYAPIGVTGSVTNVSVVSANGLNGTVANPTTTPALTLGTTVTGIVKGNGTALSAATSGTDYSAGTSALGTGIVKTTTSTGALSVAVAADFPTLNQNTSGNAATVTTNANLTGDVTSVGNATTASGALVKSVVLNTSGVLYTNPVTFTTSANTATGSLSLATQSANTILAGPTTGSATTPTFRSLVSADIPTALPLVTTVGTIGTGAWNGTVISPIYGGTGVNNGSFTNTLSGNFATTGAFNLTLAVPRSTTYTLPNTAGETLAGLGTTQSWTASQTFTGSATNIDNIYVKDPVLGYRPSIYSTTTQQLEVGTTGYLRVNLGGMTFQAGAMGSVNSITGGNNGLALSCNAGSTGNATISITSIGITTAIANAWTGNLTNISGNLTNASTLSTQSTGWWLYEAGTVTGGSAFRGNFQLFGGATPIGISAANGMQRGIVIGNATSAPTANYTAGTFLYALSNNLNTTGSLVFPLAGTGLQFKTGTNAMVGTGTLTAGVLTVSNTLVTANTKVRIQLAATSGTLGVMYTYTVTAGTGFTITSVTAAGATNTLDLSTVDWYLTEFN